MRTMIDAFTRAKTKVSLVAAHPLRSGRLRGLLRASVNGAAEEESLWNPYPES